MVEIVDINYKVAMAENFLLRNQGRQILPPDGVVCIVGAVELEIMDS